jgi:hypothetical protein
VIAQCQPLDYYPDPEATWQKYAFEINSRINKFNPQKNWLFVWFAGALEAEIGENK